MEPVKVPQHLEIEDVLVWGLTAVDLLWLGSGLLVGWWLVLNVPAALSLQIVAASPPAIAGFALGPCRFAGRPLRTLIAELATFSVRPRRRIYRGGR